MNYKLHYAPLILVGDIPCYEFKTIKELQSFIESVLYPFKMENDRVYLVVMEDEVIITENALFVIELFERKFNSVYPYYEGQPIFIQEYPSYEDAYAVALDMKEENPLCYNQQNLN